MPRIGDRSKLLPHIMKFLSQIVYYSDLRDRSDTYSTESDIFITKTFSIDDQLNLKENKIKGN